MVPVAAQASSTPRARPRRSAGNSSTIIVSATAYSAPKKIRAPKFVEATLQLDVETQKKGLAVGTWNAGEFKHTFVCAQISQAAWNCVDAGGRASLEIESATEIRLCYLDNREGAQGAGCAQLRKSQ